ncbi:MAG: penicillin-binding protein 1C [Gemmatimonadaceae bacterium]|nr:penicillin-binding protein 1C [Chitinophagaceae bacterium]
MTSFGLRLKSILKKSGIVVLCSGALFFLLNLIFPLPTALPYSTIVTDNKGEVVHAYLTPDEKWRMKTKLEEISPLLKKTLIRKEDRYFYSHPGVNPLSIARAIGNNIFRMKRTSGASTITMQVARSLEPRRRTYGAKVVEIFRALQLEWRYSKDEILQLYLNHIPYGGNIEGVKSASILYFDKSPDHLSLAEITALSIIPNRPSSLVIGKNNDLIVKERNRWLRKFAQEKLFTQKEIEDALNEPLTAVRGRVPKFIPHLAGYLKNRGSDIIPTHIDMNKQTKTEVLVQDYIRTLRTMNIRNAAVVIIDNRSHKVITYIGSADFYDTTDGGQVNGAAAVRQPGSTLKPLLYGLCIDNGLVTPKMVITDVAVNYRGYAPENYDRKFNGYVTMEYALDHSLNIPAVKGLTQLGKDRMVAALATCNFQQIKKDEQKLGLSLILGGCGASLEELTGLYSSFANDGVYTSPVYRADEKVSTGKRILSPASNFMITEVLSKVNRPDFPLNWHSTEHMPKIAWKTGTSYGRRDAWSIGYNKQYTIGVWVGNFSAQGIPELSGANIATPLLFKIFNTIDYDPDQEWFGQPTDCQIRKVCSETGLLPAEECTSVVTDYFIPLVSGTKQCANRQETMVSADEKISYCMSCVPPNGYKKKIYKAISPDMQAWMDDNRVSYVHIPVHNPDCENIFREGGPMIISPSNGSEYLLSKTNPEPVQLRCKAGNDVGKVFWYVNNKFIKSSTPQTPVFFMPTEGPVKISCTDDKGRNRDVWVTVRYINL